MENIVNYFRVFFVVSLGFLTWRAYELDVINEEREQQLETLMRSQDWYAVVYLGEEFEFSNFKFEINKFEDPIMDSDSLYIIKLTEMDL